MPSLLELILGIAIPLYAIASMASVGAGHELREVTRPFRRPVMLVTALLANFVAVPLVAVLLIRAFGLPLPYAAGLFLVAAAAGAPFLVTLARMAGADVALAGGHLLILLPATIIYMPLVLPWVLPEADVSALAIAQPLVLTMLVPLGVGMLFRRRFRDLVPTAMPILQTISRYSLIVLIAATLLGNLRDIVSLFATPAVPAAFLLLLAALIIGFAGSVGGMANRAVLALATGQRNVAAAMVVATSGFASDDPLLMVVVTSIVGFAVLFPAARLIRRQVEKRSTRSQVRFDRPEAEEFDRRRPV